MNHEEFNYLIPELTTKITKYFVKIAAESDLNKVVDTSPLLNMTMSVFIGSLINILDKIKETTIGEIELINNINLTKKEIIKAIENLPFVKGIVEFS